MPGYFYVVIPHDRFLDQIPCEFRRNNLWHADQKIVFMFSQTNFNSESYVSKVKESKR